MQSNFCSKVAPCGDLLIGITDATAAVRKSRWRQSKSLTGSNLITNCSSEFPGCFFCFSFKVVLEILMRSGRLRHFFRALGQRQWSRPWRGLSCKTALLGDHRSWPRENGVFLNFSTSSPWLFRQPHGENANLARARPAVFHFCVHLFTEWPYLLVHE